MTVTLESKIPGTFRPNAASLLPFVFGLSQRVELPGTVLVRLLGDLGLSESTARTTIQRLRRSGNLVGDRRGRAVWYRLGGLMAMGFRRLTSKPAPVEWTGTLHALLYQVPERHRAFRDSLRYAAVRRGFGILQQGVLISLHDRWADLAEVLAQRPDDAQIYPVTLTMNTADAARAAATAWQLPELNDRYRQHEHTLRAALAAEPTPTPGPHTLRTFNELMNPPLVDMLNSPQLPPELLPDNWSLPALKTALEAVEARYYPAARSYLDTVLPDQT